jgi:PilZ domain-containing protein
MDSKHPQIAPDMKDKRKYKRVKMCLPGQLFSPGTGQSLDCKVLNLSAGGAGVHCQGEFLKDTALILYVEGFGRFEGVAMPRNDGILGLSFSIGMVKQSRLKEMLALFVKDGLTGVTRSREHKRMPSLGKRSITLENGAHLVIDVLDISLNGVSLRTKTRPPIGEIVMLGHNRGRVVRHHDDGIALHFVKIVSDEAA